MMKSANEPETLLENYVSKSDELVEWLQENAYDSFLPNWPEDPFRTRFAVTHFFIALQHHKSIVLLITHGCYGSAFALVRILAEAYVRGLWVSNHASPTDIENIVKEGKLKKKVGVMLNDIANNNENDKELLSVVKNQMWSEISNDVHTGTEQVLRHNTDKAIKPNFTDKDIIEKLHFVNTFGLFTGFQMNSASGVTNHAGQILEKMYEHLVYHDAICRSLTLES